MAENKKLVPKRRFKEFQNTDAWEQRKLGKVIDGLYNGQTPSRFRDEFWNGNINWLSSGELNLSVVRKTKEKITHEGQEEANLRVISQGTFVMAITGLEAAGTRGSCGILGIDTTLNQSCMAVFPDKRRLNTQFLFQWYKKVGEKYGIRYTQGTKQQSYNAELIKKLEISLPKVEEQSRIGDLLTTLDNLITFHQRKLEKTKALKAAFLSEMFPTEGESEPKRRFAGFTGAWEQRKLGELGEVITGSTPSTQVQAYYSDDGIPWVTPTDISENVTFRTAKHLSEEGKKVARVVPQNTVLVTSIASIGKNTMLGTTGSFNQQINGLVPKEKENYPYFLFTESALWSEKMKRSAAAGTMQIVNKTEFSELRTYVPSLEEQTHIGSFFQHLDNLITLHQCKLEKLQNIKKAYLNEMFI